MDRYLIYKRYRSRDKTTVSSEDYFNVIYYNHFLNPKLASKFFTVLNEQLEYHDEPVEQRDRPKLRIAYGEDNVHYYYGDDKVKTKSWNGDDTICKVLRKIRKRIEDISNKKFNFVMINKYSDGDDYFGYHCDDERQMIKYSSICGLSLIHI